MSVLRNFRSSRAVFLQIHPVARWRHLGLVNRRYDSQDELRIYDLANGGERCARKKFTGWIALSPDGKLFATLEGDNQIKVWELPLATNEKKP
jgi:hypothetical protein